MVSVLMLMCTISMVEIRQLPYDKCFKLLIRSGTYFLISSANCQFEFGLFPLQIFNCLKMVVV